MAHTPRKATTLGWRSAAIMLASLRVVMQVWGSEGGECERWNGQGWTEPRTAHPNSICLSVCSSAHARQLKEAWPVPAAHTHSLFKALQHGVREREGALRIVRILNVHLQP